MNETISKVIDFSRRGQLFPERCAVLAAVSGGADSMALLDILLKSREELGIDRITVFHLNHNQRGTESDSDEEVVRNCCERNHIPFLTRKLSNAEAICASEESLRDLRYKYLFQTKEETGSELIAVGHTASDQVETVLFRLMRGTGLLGASGMHPVNGGIIRPLLCLTREETEQYCREQGIDFVCDSSNLDDRYARNYIRKHIVPQMKACSDNLEEHFAAFSAVASEADGYFRSNAERYIGENAETGLTSIKTLQLKTEPEIIRSYVLMAFMEKNGIAFDHDDLKKASHLVLSGGRLQLKGGHLLVGSREELILDPVKEKKSFPVSKESAADYSAFGKTVHISVDYLRNVHMDSQDHVFFSYIDYDKVNGDVCIRNWREGDRFTSLRRRCTKPLKKLFNERKYSLREKEQMLILQDEKGILWVEGEGICPRAAVSNETEKVMTIELKRGNSVYDE